MLLGNHLCTYEVVMDGVKNKPQQKVIDDYFLVHVGICKNDCKVNKVELIFLSYFGDCGDELNYTLHSLGEGAEDVFMPQGNSKAFCIDDS